MKYARYVPYLLSASLIDVVPASARESVCNERLNWDDATFVRRATRIGDSVIEARMQRYSDGLIYGWTGGGSKVEMIKLKHVYLTSGASTPNEFEEIGIILDPPVKKSAGPFGKPCAIPDGREMPYSSANWMGQYSPEKDGVARFRGTISRRGTGIRYFVASTAERSQNAPIESMEGELRYDANLEPFPQDKDVQGWTVYRGDMLLMTVPTGNPLPLEKLLTNIKGEAP